MESIPYFVLRIIMSFSLTDKNQFEKMYWQRCFTSLLLIFLWGAAFGQNTKPVPLKRCPVKTINFEQGLLNNTITDVITDGIGFTWFSTATGLQRYNGYVLETITPVADGDTIHINYPVFFLSGKNNSILIGYKKGVLEFNPENNSFKKIISIDPLANLHYSLLPLKETNEGIWCLQDGKGIVIYNGNNSISNQVVLPDESNIHTVISSTEILAHSLIATNDYYIFIRLSPKKILQVNIHTHQFKFFDFTGPDIYGLTCSNDKVYVASGAGLSYIKIKNGEIVQKFLFKQITNDQIASSAIEWTGNGQILVSAQKHLFEFDTSCAFKREITTLNGDLILGTGIIKIILEDKLKRIWLVTNDDIKRIQNIETPFEHLIYPKEKNNFVRSIYYDTVKHVLLAGCYNGGIQLFDSSGNPVWNNSIITNEVKDILSIEKLSAYNYLIVTFGKGLYLLNIETKQLHAIDLSAPSFSQFNIRDNKFTNNLQRIDDSTIFISTNSNVFRCTFLKNEIKSAIPLLPVSPFYEYPVTCFFYSADKSLWVGIQSGFILKLDAKGLLQKINIPDNYIVRCMAEDATHNIWVGTEKGLFIYSSSGVLLKRVTKETGLLNDFIYALLPADGNNNFFASTNLGLSFISKEGVVKNYTKELGLQDNEFNTQSCAKSTTGKLFFGGVNGITAFYPGALSSLRDTPIINITRFVVNDSLYNSIGSSWRSDSIRLAYNQNHIQFDIAATGLLNPEEYLYQYRLKGFEESWQTTNQPTGIRYTLGPGNYLLEIKCSPILSSNTVFYKKIMITIDQPWWQTWWFRAIVFAVLVFLIALIVLRYNKQKYEEKIRTLQLKSEIQNERERISKELHDNIGTQLSYISSNVDWILDSPVSFSREEEVKRLSAVNITTKDIISDLRETIWAIKKEYIQMDELADKLKLFIQTQRILKPEMDINISEDIKHNTRFSPTEALNIFRICQEAIGNCIKHANASQLGVSIQSGPKENFLIAIEDNGKGFLQNIGYEGHYGLENMRIRANELGAILSIVSEEKKGTRIILTKA